MKPTAATHMYVLCKVFPKTCLYNVLYIPVPWSWWVQSAVHYTVVEELVEELVLATVAGTVWGVGQIGVVEWPPVL